jgi:23S rRNA pseudouridine955/2504/2580 synthase
LLVVDKPAGWAVHGGSGVQWGVLEWLRQHHEAGQALELVHRLDRETSGVLVLAKKRQALQRLQAAFRARSVQKRYVALSHGHWPRAQQVVDVALLKTHSADGQRVVRAVGPETEGAQRSISVVSRIKNCGGRPLRLKGVKPAPRGHGVTAHVFARAAINRYASQS